MFRIFVKTCVRIFTLLIFRVKTYGQENIEKDKPYLICANHTSNWDPVLLYTATKTPIYMIAKEELFKTKFTAWFFNRMNIIPVKRGKKDIESIKKSIKILNDNKILAVFPEGTRNGMKKNGKIQNGPSYLAIRTGVEVLPVRIEASFKPFSTVKIFYDKPISFIEYQSKKPEKETLELVSNRITNELFNNNK